MNVLLTNPVLWSNHLMPDRSRQLLETNVMRRSLRGRHTCPLCSTALLRHMRLGGLYWRCSHCNDEMPVL
ncbi:MAG: hypothetical protein KME42_13240 [Tildeniella nuda ZEHNDER 1965/U140]|nr:hypothetical protein [Tildeniella nuda ZEHNDER 1965/U140]